MSSNKRVLSIPELTGNDSSKRLKTTDSVVDSDVQFKKEPDNSEDCKVDCKLEDDGQNISNQGRLPSETEEQVATSAEIPTKWGREKVLKAWLAGAPSEERATKRKQINDALKAFAFRSVSLSEDRCFVTGMTSGLFLYQMLGTSWMRGKETGSALPRGGILADEMGLGKTIQMIANITDDLKRGYKGSLEEHKEIRKRKTLIIVPNAVLANQWHKEFRKHCTPKMFKLHKIGQYHGQSRGTKGGKILDQLKPYRIIITTFHEVLQQFQDRIPKKFESKKEEKAIKRWKRKHPHRTGPFFDMDFHRVVLDEAQKILNEKSLTSRSCRALRGKHIWALTGTPVRNSPEELYPYFDLLNLPGANSLSEFRNTYLDQATGSGNSNLDKTLAEILLRRTKQNEMLGKPILVVPECDKKTVWLDLNAKEKQIYEVTRKKTKEKVLKIIKDANGKVKGRQKTRVINLVMELRMQTAHFLLTPRVMTPASGAAEDSEEMLSNNDIDELLQLGYDGPALDPKKLKAMRSCIRDFGREYERQKAAWAKRALPTFNKKQLNKIKRETIGSGLFKYRTDLWRKKKFPLILSTKLNAVILQIKAWLHENPTIKIVVFTQFIEVENILSDALKSAKIGHEKYNGEMSDLNQEEALESFVERPKKKVLLATLQAGGTGLNLQCASRAIIVDMWWNKAQEEQAIGRIERAGQKFEMEVVTFAVRDTIDEAIMEMKEKKSTDIEAILEKKVQLSVKGFSTEDLMKLLEHKVSTNELLIDTSEVDEDHEPHQSLRNGDESDDEGDNEDSESESDDESDLDEDSEGYHGLESDEDGGEKDCEEDCEDAENAKGQGDSDLSDLDYSLV